MDITDWKYESVPLDELENLSLKEVYIPAWFGPKDFTTLKSRWKSDAGVFLFLKMTREEEIEDSITSLESQLKKYLSKPVHKRVRFLWIENPLEPLSQWRSNSISVEGDFGNRRVSNLTHLDLHNYSFSISKGTTIKLEKNGLDKNGRVAYQFVFSKIKKNLRGFELSAGYGLHRFSDISDTVILPMYDDSLGCLQFELVLKKEINTEEETASFGYPSLSQLDIGLRMFFRDPEFPEPGDSFYLASHRYPIFDETHPQLDGNDNPHKAFKYYPEVIPFKVQLDLLYPLVGGRTHFIFKEILDIGKNTGLPSSYRTNLGYRVHLIPLLEKSRLQFALRPSLLSNENGHSTPFYLVPEGQFKIQVPNYHDDASIDFKGEANVNCGISGVEYIKIKSGIDPETNLEIDSKSVAIFTFVPGRAAYAPSHVSVTALLRDFPIIYEEGTEDKLDPDTTDQDATIIGKRTDLNIIDDKTGVDYLEIIKKDYFPTNFSFSISQSAEYNKLERVEELVTWLKDTLISSGIGEGDLNDQATTSWVYITQGTGAVYYAQPEQAILYKAEGSSSNFLDFLEIPSVGLPPKLEINGEARAFPMLPYGDVDPYALADLKLLEVSIINHFRRKRIQEISTDIGDVIPLVPALEEVEEDVKNAIGTTPQGLIATFTNNFKTISRLELARDTHEPTPKVIPFVDINHGSKLKAALQSNQLFMVISDPSSIKDNFKKDLEATLDTLDTTSMEIKKWIFELGTESWDKNNRNTLLIFKFHDKPLLELAARPELWSFPGHFNGDNEAEVSSTLLSILYEAIEIGGRVDPKESGKYEVLAEAATQANWTGILGFNIHVPPSGLPPELMALAAGIDPDLFFAKYIGIELTQVTSDGTNLKPEGSSLFGLIDYSNPEIPVAKESGYNFHVASLVVVFENSRIKDFAAEILLVIEKLFDEPSRLLDSSRNIVSLIGVAEEHNGKMTNSFGFKGANRFKLSGNAFEEVEIVKAQFVTDPIPDLDANPINVVGRFIFWGRIRYAYLEQFDILSFGKSPSITTEDPDYLSFSNMQILMEFELETESDTEEDVELETGSDTEENVELETDSNTEEDESSMPISTFTFVPNQMAFDLEKSGWRTNSLYEKFPLTFKGFLIGKPDGSLQRGFMDVNTPLEPIVLGEGDSQWYGMSFALNMESSEDIGAKAKIKADILVGWNAGKKGTYVGLRFPGSSGTDRSITIVGILKLVFKSLRFVVYPLTTEWDDNGNKLLKENAEREVGYLLNLKNIRLEFFVLSFPPTGRTEITLFGDPRKVNREERLVGWYAAYVKK
jgi:hypothetical protein